jgi:hypothetical protein
MGDSTLQSQATVSDGVFTDIAKKFSTADIRTVYKFEKLLGGGHFGTVRLAHRISDPHVARYAVKSILKENIKKDVKLLEEELAIGGLRVGNTRGADFKIAMLPPAANPDGEAEIDDELADRASLSDIVLESTEVGERPQRSKQKERAAVKSGRNGSLVHTVTFPGENLSVVALWYTGGASNVGAIAKASGVKAAAPLKLGDNIVIPARLLRTRQGLSAGDLRRLMQ